jgi:hypothetical protein
MLSIINLTVSATDEPSRANAIESFHDASRLLMSRNNSMHVAISTRDYGDDELIKEEPDYEQMYNELAEKIQVLYLEWAESDVKYKNKMANELLEKTGQEL